ncbi:MAG: MarR family transcriptional regulator [Pseudorhodobacter sp.]|nr:MarR family transcriptional regulator [Pseudorhodobacter sp.]
MKNETHGLGMMLHDAARAVRRAFEERSAAFGLSSAQWRMMVHVCKVGSAPQSRFADLLEVEPISVSRSLDRLEAQGWVTRQNDPGDRRVRLVLPTPKALQAFDHIRTIADEVYGLALAGMTEDEKRILMAGLSTIVTNLAAVENTALDKVAS